MSGVIAGILRLALLPLRAPFLLLLLLVSIYLGVHWVVNAPVQGLGNPEQDPVHGLYWTAECLQALLVVVVASLPDLLLRQLSMLMAASRVITLIVSLFLVTVGGLYLLHLSALADVVILATAVLLARLDLTRIRVVPSPLFTAFSLSGYVMLGIWIGRELQLGGLMGTVPGT
ncbi:hypothetical protein KBZ18_07585 [Synechococcus sp. Cruz-9H2]|uniref:hypothetical protein n=1 Tax=unclassified Synechococcus TaxID=2626047 RepID=UPI0020CD01AE|nr:MULTISPECIES: hypothetical protein [unclassified Synechococcus]MCP9819353.1 hypothetical protein [Synechococcus sp. Cruz-9H2]MCP9843146.1 hypothetical protein [Synechococcus sp. Edmonson 11F2]MCP9854891.1 hypothetical protein [Synechococcus sp. Cruz-9C9]MCP9862638.1 hypothetical protein [Synechococcus sp. Cruz-7E5]MCP9870263.1 hypothetical protein [Synechococcus sp. Cruz-7B9]